MNQSTVICTKHQQVLFQLQQLRGRLILRPSDIGMMDEELEGLRLSVEKSDLIDSDEVDQICQLLSSFRMAMLSDLRQ